MSYRIERARTIMAQMGGSRFMTMVGANQIVATDEGVRFRVPNAKNRIKALEVVLNGKDLYDMRWLNIRGFECKQVAEDKDVYADQLEDFFQARTGLATRL